MALMTCPDCKTQHSDLATACPKCARPVAVGTPRFAPSGPVQRTDQVPVTIEHTSKRWKRLLVVGIVLILVGMFSCAVGVAAAAGGGDTGMPIAAMLGTLLMLTGMIMVIVASLKAWWHHG